MSNFRYLTIFTSIGIYAGNDDKIVLSFIFASIGKMS